jgi:hypothetical protein
MKLLGHSAQKHNWRPIPNRVLRLQSDFRIASGSATGTLSLISPVIYMHGLWLLRAVTASTLLGFWIKWRLIVGKLRRAFSAHAGHGDRQRLGLAPPKRHAGATILSHRSNRTCAVWKHACSLAYEPMAISAKAASGHNETTIS